MKYTSEEIQEIINDLDHARLFFTESDDSERERVARSIGHASHILKELPDEALERVEIPTPEDIERGGPR